MNATWRENERKWKDVKAKWKNERKELKVKLKNECNMKRKWKEMKGHESKMKKWAKGTESKIKKWMQHEEKMKGNKSKMNDEKKGKGEWKENEWQRWHLTFHSFPPWLSKPQKARKFTLFGRGPTPWNETTINNNDNAKLKQKNKGPYMPLPRRTKGWSMSLNACFRLLQACFRPLWWDCKPLRKWKKAFLEKGSTLNTDSGKDKPKKGVPYQIDPDRIS